MKGKAKRKSQDLELENTVMQVENIIGTKIIQICTIYPSCIICVFYWLSLYNWQKYVT